ncbi:hypothetical protein Tco_0973587 [Tanacetum coccineum]
MTPSLRPSDAVTRKKQTKFPRQVVSNSNPFDALNPVENDDDLGTNEGNSKLDDKGVKSLSSPTNTPLTVRIKNLERQILDGKLVLVDDDEKMLKKVESPINSDSESEVKEVINETPGFMASTSLKSGSESGYGTKSL